MGDGDVRPAGLGALRDGHSREVVHLGRGGVIRPKSAGGANPNARCRAAGDVSERFRFSLLQFAQSCSG